MNKELIEKLEKEFEELDMKLNKLVKFLNSSAINTIGNEQYRLLTIQASSMQTYVYALRGRIELLKKEGDDSND